MDAHFFTLKERTTNLEGKLQALRKELEKNKELIDAVKEQKRARRGAVINLAEAAERNLEALLEQARAALRSSHPQLAAQLDAAEGSLGAIRANAESDMEGLRKEEYELDGVALKLEAGINKLERELAVAYEELNGAMDRMVEGRTQPMSTARGAPRTPPLHQLPR